MKHLFFLLASLLIISCNKSEEPIPSTPAANLTKISIENRQFINANGDVFFPWGFNYTNADDVGLIEDDWYNEVMWQTIQSDFIEMKALGANVVRIHLQYHQFMSDASTPNIMAFQRLKELVEFAEMEGLYLDITGLSSYRKSDQPNFYNLMRDDERWNTQKLFWETTAETIGDNPAVFAFNLMNEPVVSVGCNSSIDCEWLPGDGQGGLHFVQNITRTPGNNYITTLKSWMSELSQAIRSKDNETLITVGLLGLGSFGQFGEDLDYVSLHEYPQSGQLQESINKVIANQSGVPLIIEETYNLNCNIGELEEFIDGVDGGYQGLMGHYFGTPLEDLSDLSIRQAIQKNFLEFFIANNPN